MKVSFEFFPPKTPEGLVHLVDTAKRLAQFSPEYFSVTYGAGGSTQDMTLKTVAELQQDGFGVAPHISCIGATKAKVMELLQLYQQQGVKRLVALRGDLPSGQGSLAGDFRYARDLVAFIREEMGNVFHISVAAYPEIHPQARSAKDDLLYFKQKAVAGADLAITQYFYHPDAYAQLLEDCQALDIQIPIIPGIMPIYGFSQLVRFSEMCGAEVPRYMRKHMEGFGDDIEATQAFGVEVVTRLCEAVIAAGAPALHFYTLNKDKLVTQILENL